MIPAALRAWSRLLSFEKPAPEEPPEYICVSCDKTGTRSRHKHKFIPLQCDHVYCVPCMVKFISASLDSSNLEPRCCNHGIDIQSTISRLPWASRTSIRHRYFLLTRGYCGNPSCSARLSMAKTDIGADGPVRIIYCRTCRSTTCLKCRNLHHPGRSCRENDASLAQLLDLGKSSGWKRCTSCGALVERTDGCQYVKCRCGVYSKIPNRK